ncbi:MAG: MFS transporter [Parvibaculum sp.]|uniref:MFS transporter n=1 Tax=Parvibaculum sp. TaxID=2024848 RepID=UPI00284A4310|nr:MFS transporter [Parvibaculum sp.]MDR3498540.1 MFS transporter [Parvibaculum sp.]
MSILSDLRLLTPKQRNAVLASYLGWTLDAFDFFILVFVLKDVAAEFSTDVQSASYAIALTLMMRPVGALIFGLAADRYGRRPVLMLNILFYSTMELLSGFAPTLTALIVLRALFGIAMGGEWGVGASLAMETIPPKLRGPVSGLLQTGYPTGNLIASLVFFIFFPLVGWRGMFVIGAAPALLVLYIRWGVEESPVYIAHKMRRGGAGLLAHAKEILGISKTNILLFLYAIALMAAFNAFSHGTQDLYPTFLREQHGFDVHAVSLIVIIGNIGAIIGGLTSGTLSERFGRRRMIAIAALLALPVIPLWAYSTSTFYLALGGFLIQICVQGAWGIVPAHLNELSPDELRGTFPGFAYQLGNLIVSLAAPLQAGIAKSHGGDYSLALASVAGGVAIVLAALAWFGVEKKGVAFGADASR